MNAPEMTRSLGDFSPFDPAIQDDPYAATRGLHVECPVAHSEAFGGYWVVTGYDEMVRVFADPKTFSSSNATVPKIEDPLGKRLPIEIDPPEHTHYRHLFAPLCAPGVAKRLEGATRAVARELLAGLAGRTSFDFVAEFAIPQWSRVFLGHFLGIPVEDAQQILDWKESLMSDFLSGDPERIQRAATETFPAMIAYYEQRLDEREAMADQPDDFMTGLLKGRYAGERPLTRNEILRTIFLLHQAGLDTVVGSLGFAVYWLATHPEQRREVVEDPALLHTAVEELLRHSGSVISTGRTVAHDTEFAGVSMREGDSVLLPTWASGRDPRTFQNPDEVDLRRNPNRHMVFGSGIHRCVGSHLARMEIRAVLDELHRAFPDYQLDPDRSVTRRLGLSAMIEQLWLVIPG